MSTLNPPLQLVNPESVEYSKYLLEEANKPDYDYPPVSEHTGVGEIF